MVPLPSFFSDEKMIQKQKNRSDRLQPVSVETPPNLGPGAYFAKTWKPDTVFLYDLMTIKRFSVVSYILKGNACTTLRS